jgi:hypothetical protein
MKIMMIRIGELECEAAYAKLEEGVEEISS